MQAGRYYLQSGNRTVGTMLLTTLTILTSCRTNHRCFCVRQIRERLRSLVPKGNCQV